MSGVVGVSTGSRPVRPRDETSVVDEQPAVAPSAITGLAVLGLLQLDGLYFGLTDLLGGSAVGSSRVLIPLRVLLMGLIVVQGLRRGVKVRSGAVPAVLMAAILMSAMFTDDGSSPTRRYVILIATLGVPAALTGVMTRPVDLSRVTGATAVVGYLLIGLFARSFLVGSADNADYLNDVAGGSHLVVGQSMAVVFVMALHRLVSGKGSTAVAGGQLVGSTVLIVVSGSRGALVGVAGAMILLLVLGRRPHHGAFSRARVTGLALIVIVGTAWLIPRLLSGGSLALEKITSLWTGTVEDQARTELYATAWERIQERPAWGHGVGSFAKFMGEYIYPHNVFLEVGNDFGAIGLAALLVVGAVVAKRALDRGEGAGPMLPILVLVFIVLQFSGTYTILPLFWLSFGAVWASLSPGRQQSGPTRKARGRR